MDLEEQQRREISERQLGDMIRQVDSSSASDFTSQALRAMQKPRPPRPNMFDTHTDSDESFQTAQTQ